MMSLFAYGLSSRGLVEARSLMFMAIIVFELVFAFSCRSQSQTVFRLGVTSNKYLVAAVLSQLCLLLLIMYVPSVARLFEVTPIGIIDWLVVAAVGISGFVLAEASKVFAARLRRRS
jgi:Ca2+-transporting ATPase